MKNGSQAAIERFFVEGDTTASCPPDSFIDFIHFEHYHISSEKDFEPRQRHFSKSS
jgi:hypothetical protein